MFLLSIKDDHEQPSEIERLGIRDLEIARDMDVEIVDQGEEVGWGRIARATKLFQVGLTRVRGLLVLLEMGYPDEWDLEAKLEGLLDMLDLEALKENSDLFSEVGYVGHLQEVEAEVMKYKMIRNDVETAAKVAVRCLFEDEYLFAETKVEASHVLNAYVRLNEDKWDVMVQSSLKKWLEDSMDAVSTGLSSERQANVSDQFLSVLRASIRQVTGDEAVSSWRKGSSIRFSLNDQSSITMEHF